MSQSPATDKSIHFIELAKELSNISSEDELFEAKMRATIGRLYYGVFNLLIDRFSNCTNSKLDFTLKQSLRDKEGAHGSLKKCISKTNSSMRTHIDNLRLLRNFCDYDIEKNVMEKIIIEKGGGMPSLEYDDIQFAYADAMASAITLIQIYTNHQNCYDGRGHATIINISAT